MSFDRTEFLNTFAVVTDCIDDLMERKFNRLESCGEPNFYHEMNCAKITLLSMLKSNLLCCTDCKLHQTRIQMVFGEGNPAARIMFIGEGPGQHEDETGRPFVGKAGELLDKIIASMNLKREDVYIANVVKCRPPGNRNPENDEVLQCRKYLDLQIEIIRPMLIVALGSPAIKTLLDTDQGIVSLRGKFQKYKGIWVMPTFHPAYLLRNPDAKKDTWEDVKKIISFLKEIDVQL